MSPVVSRRHTVGVGRNDNAPGTRLERAAKRVSLAGNPRVSLGREAPRAARQGRTHPDDSAPLPVPQETRRARRWRT